MFTFDTVQNTFNFKGDTEEVGPNAIWLTFDKSQKFMISASASNFENHEKTGGVFSASVGCDGTLKKISSSSTPEMPVSIGFYGEGNAKMVAVASYVGASLTTYNIGLDGKLSSQPIQTFQFKGSGPVKDRQGTAAAHQAKLDPSGQILLVPDLGSDRVHSFTVAKSGQLTQNTDIVIKAGCGPRHLEYGPINGNAGSGSPIRFYLICELSSEILLIELSDPSKGTVSSVKQTISALPNNLNPSTFNAAEILITPDGKFLYSTNRQKDPAGRLDDNSFAVFTRDSSSGELKSAGFFPTGGKGPRHFAFSPDGLASLVVVTNQDSNLVAVHKRNLTSGALSQVASISAESPVVALFKI